MKIFTYNEIDSTQWQELLDKSSTASYFQSRECYDFYCRLSFLTPFLIGVSEDGQLTGLVCGYIISDGNAIKRFFSRRAIVPGGLLLAEDISEVALIALLDELKRQLTDKAIYIEIRNYNDYTAYRASIESAGFIYKPHLNFRVNTPDVETAFKNLNTTKRRDVRLSLKQGAEILLVNNTEDVQVYYKILKQLYQEKIKTPLFPLEFFEKLALSDAGRLFVVKYQHEIIGGSVCVAFDNKTLYEWFVCGRDGELKNIFPSTLATWAAIEYAAANKFEKFDMMGAGKPEEGYGVRQFKSEFGGELVEHGRFLYINNPLLYKTGEFAIKMLRKIK